MRMTVLCDLKAAVPVISRHGMSSAASDLLATA